MGKQELPKRKPTEQQVLSLLGLCARQGAAKSGEFSADKAIKEGKAKLVIVSADASDNTKKGFQDACAYYKVPIRIFSDRDSLGHAIGFEYRVSVAITNEGLAGKIAETIDALMEVPNLEGTGGK